MEDAVHKITSSYATVAQYLNDNFHQQPSFSAESGPLRFPDAPEHINAARYTLVTAARDLQLLALYPIEALNAVGIEACEPFGLHMICTYDIPSHVPLKGSISYTELSAKTGITEQRLMRVLRHAMLSHIFHEPTPGHVAHTSLTAPLVTSSEARALFYYMISIYPIFPSITETMQKYGPQEAEKLENSGIRHHFNVNTGENTFEHMQRIRPDMFKLFNEMMQASVEGTTPEQVANGYDWGRIGSGTVVDVGGSLGHIGIAIAKAFPALKVVIQDITAAVENGQSQLDPSLQSQVSFMKHDFFNTNPVKNADVYFFSRILHDWPDETAIAILRGVVNAMGPNSRIIICEKIVPEPGTIQPWHELTMRRYDMIMMILNGCERSMQQWEKLIRETDERLAITRVEKPEGSLASLIEVSWLKSSL